MPSRPDSVKVSATVVASSTLLACTVVVLYGYIPALLWATVLTVAIWPAYRKLENWRSGNGWKRIGAPLLATVAVAVVIAIPVALAALVFGREAHSLMQWAGNVEHTGIEMPSVVGRLPIIGAYAANWWQANLAPPDAAAELIRRIGPGLFLGWTRSFGAEILRRSLQFLITLVTLFFLFRDGDNIKGRLASLGRRVFGLRSNRILDQIVGAIHGTIDGLVLVGLAEGAVIGVGYWVAGVPHALTFAVITGIVAIIPMGAPLIFCSAAIVLAFEERTIAAVALLVFGFLVLFVTDHIVRPIVIGGPSRVPFILVLIGVLGGLASLGLIGLFVGPALMAILITLWRDYTDIEEEEQ
jgi:predicted PurR-regulated permease PerM